MNTDILVVIGVVAVGLLAIIIIPLWRMKQAIPQVLRIFRANNALDAKNAKTIDELGLRPRGMMEGMFRGRDFKPHALSSLTQAGIIAITGDGRYYLVEERLVGTRLYNK